MEAATLFMVVFVGVVGPDAGHVNKQLGALLRHDAKVNKVEVSAGDQKALGTHDDRAEKIVKKMKTDGVVAGEVVEGRKGRRLRVYVYDKDGNVESQVEVPLEDGTITRGGVTMLEEAVVADVVTLQASSEPAKPSKKSKKKAEEPPPEEDLPQASDDEVASSGGGGDSPAAQAVEEDSDTPAELTEKAAAPSAEHAVGMHMAAAVGVGFVARTFLPGPESLTSYNAPPVGTLRVAADLEPVRRLRLDAEGERSFGMVTNLPGGMTAATTISRWQAQLSFDVLSGGFSLAPAVGIGQRSFSMDSTLEGRTPDSDYIYVVAGARAAMQLGRRTQVALLAGVEPVISGAQPTEEEFGNAARLGYEAELTVDVQLTPWLLARAEAGYQAFNWTFYGGETAEDRYAGGAVSLGARY